MTTELWILMATAALQWVLILTASTPRMTRNGIPWALGNRATCDDDVPEWARRAQAASDNLQENLAPAAIVLLVVHVSGLANDTSALGAMVFFGARIAHAGFYIAGVPVVRTVAWMTSLGGLLLVASTLL